MESFGIKTKFLMQSVMVTALAFSGAATAAITVYTTQASFNAATSNQGVDTFTGFSISGATPSPITRTAGVYSYTGSASTTSFFGAGTTANPWLSTNTATDTMTFNAFTGGVQAVGGNFFGSDITGSFLSGNITLTATDSSGTVTQTIVGATTTSFLGFVSTGAMTSLTVASVQPATGFLWPTVDNLTLAKIAAPVPEPETYAMFLAGLAMVSVIARRRRPS
jgi:PEP-CTERM motif